MTRSDGPDPLGWLADELAGLESQGLRRQRRERTGPQGVHVRVEGRDLLNFASNDYLGLAGDPRLTDAVRQTLEETGWGAGASPLVSGFGTWHRRLEERLAQFKGTEAAIVFPSGFAANLGTISALAGPGDVVFGDHANHASLIDGCRLSGARFRTWPHGRLDRLADLLAREPARRRLIVTDTLFSMDGDIANLVELADLAERFEAMLIVDEAHASGVFGPHGRGAAELQGVEHRIDASVGTLSKAFGAVGGFVAGSRTLIDWLVNRARSYLFSTALPEANAAAACIALEIAQAEPHRRTELLDRSARLRGRLVSAGWDIGQSTSQIIPILLGDPARAVELSARLSEAGIWAPAIRPPSVPQGTSRLRLSLSALHTDAMLDQLLQALANAPSA